jgi:predicted nucleotidyltransferase
MARAAEDLAARARARWADRIQAVRVFGSSARGDADADSDLDVFVRLNGLVESERRDLFEIAADVSLTHLITVQVFAPSPSELDWLERYECRILQDIAVEGVPL